MKVFLDVSAVRNPLTGIGRYVFELARHLSAGDGGLQMEFIAGARRSTTPPVLPAHTPGDAPRSLPARVRGLITRSPFAVELYQRLTCARQTRLLRGEHGLFHGPQFRLPSLDMPGVVTIHDLSVYSRAECHPASRVKATRTLIENAVARASHVITDSEFTRQEILQHFGLPETTVSAVHLACTEDFRPRSESEVSEALRTHGLRHRGYAFFSGTIEPRKNLDRLIDAYARLPEQLRLEYPLVLCGHRGWKSEATHARIERAQAEGWLRYLGYVDEATLPVLFAGARLFVFPSLYEGFGLPVLEAMASDTPVVCATSASLPEVAGDAAAMFDPLDTDSLCALLQQGLEDSGWQEAARSRGLEQATRFTWQRCAEETARIYRMAHTG